MVTSKGFLLLKVFSEVMKLNFQKFKWGFLLIIITVLFISSSDVWAMQSSNYIINWDSINAGGTDNSSSPNYQVRDTMGQMGPGKSDSPNWEMRSGYRQVRDEPEQLVFAVKAQNNSTQVSYSAFDSSGKTVTVSSVSGYAVNDHIAVVENLGQAQMVAVGQITSIASPIITVDKWSGDNDSMSASPAGGNDYVYKLDTNNIALGALTPTSVSTGVAITEITTNASSGYTVYVREDHNLRLGQGPNDVNDVTGGTVDAGSEEYGIETTGDNAQGSGDWAITTNTQQVADSSSDGSEERVAIIYKATAGAQTVAGEYSHTTSYTCIANF